MVEMCFKNEVEVSSALCQFKIGTTYQRTEGVEDKKRK